MQHDFLLLLKRGFNCNNSPFCSVFLLLSVNNIWRLFRRKFLKIFWVFSFVCLSIALSSFLSTVILLNVTIYMTVLDFLNHIWQMSNTNRPIVKQCHIIKSVFVKICEKNVNLYHFKLRHHRMNNPMYLHED